MLGGRPTCFGRTVLANYMLGVVFDNLFSNSLKFGGKDVEISVTGEETPYGLVEIYVSDNGPGIPNSMKNLVLTVLWRTPANGAVTGSDLILSRCMSKVMA